MQRDLQGSSMIGSVAMQVDRKVTVWRSGRLALGSRAQTRDEQLPGGCLRNSLTSLTV